ncbi:MAG: A24 family peptidase [Gemmataceae bacterium]|nr:A24 family peptidase [Gemmataceae bacterium]
MDRPFFPDVVFGWTFFGVLAALLLVAAVIDLRQTKVPKWLTFPILGLGVIFNITRGSWLGALEQPVWAFASDGPVVGALDGLLFALVGFLAGFAIFCGMWILGLCGGGDVKLFAALGAWIGPYYCLWALAGSMLVLVVLSVLRVLYLFVTQGYTEAKKAYSAKQGKKSPAGRVPRHRLMTYSLPLAVATAAILLWFFRVELQLVDRPAAGAPRQSVRTVERASHV